MSSGNLKTYGGKGTNLPFQQSVLLLLGAIEELTASSSTSLAQESTLISVLNAIVASHQDIEILLVRQLSTGDVLQQITNYETGVPVVTYKDVNGNVIPSPGAVEYLDPSAVLNLILTQVTAINNAIHLEKDDDAIAVEQVLPTNINLLYGAFEGEGLEWERIQTDGNGYLKGISDILIEVGLIKTNTTSIDAALTATVRTPSLTRAVAAGSVAAGARSVSVYNAGTTAGVWLGAAINPGEQLSYDAGAQGDTLGAFAYTASATAELVITTIV